MAKLEGEIARHRQLRGLSVSSAKLHSHGWRVRTSFRDAEGPCRDHSVERWADGDAPHGCADSFTQVCPQHALVKAITHRARVSCHGLQGIRNGELSHPGPGPRGSGSSDASISQPSRFAPLLTDDSDTEELVDNVVDVLDAQADHSSELDVVNQVVPELHLQHTHRQISPPPAFLRGAYRSAMRTALLEISSGMEQSNNTRVVRGWKLFVLFPRMFSLKTSQRWLGVERGSVCSRVGDAKQEEEDRDGYRGEPGRTCGGIDLHG